MIRTGGWYLRAKTRYLVLHDLNDEDRLPEHDWLIPQLIEPLHAVDVPVARLFTLAALRQRANRERRAGHYHTRAMPSTRQMRLLRTTRDLARKRGRV